MSISADTHKYGYAPKGLQFNVIAVSTYVTCPGSSVVMYRDAKYRCHQYSVVTDWPGGVYATQTISGSRAGGNIATCWASLMYHGHEGYLNSARKVMQVARRIKQEMKKIDGLFIYGDPLVSVIAFGSHKFSALEMAEQMSKRGWNLNTLQVSF